MLTYHRGAGSLPLFSWIYPSILWETKARQSCFNSIRPYTLELQKFSMIWGLCVQYFCQISMWLEVEAILLGLEVFWDNKQGYEYCASAKSAEEIAHRRIDFFYLWSGSLSGSSCSIVGLLRIQRWAEVGTDTTWGTVYQRNHKNNHPQQSRYNVEGY